MSMLMEAEKLMDKTGKTEVDVTFECLGEVDGETETKHYGLLVLPRDEWEDMGRPDEITVRIVAGDELNK